MYMFIPQLQTYTELTMSVVGTEIIWSHEFAPVLYQQREGTGSLKIFIL